MEPGVEALPHAAQPGYNPRCGKAGRLILTVRLVSIILRTHHFAF